jgi:NTP pyrophosphatase (non-canonical NTP hydrolase)
MYLYNGLGGECGEVQNEVKKLYRLLMINPNHQSDINSRKENIKTELGDMLWYMFAIANELDIKIDDIIANNMSKNTHNVDIDKN